MQYISIYHSVDNGGHRFSHTTICFSLISMASAGRDSVPVTPCNTPISVDTTISVILQYIYYSVDITVQSHPAKHLSNLLQGGHNGFSHPEIHLSNILQRGQLLLLFHSHPTVHLHGQWPRLVIVLVTLHYASIIGYNEDSVTHTALCLNNLL